MELKTEYRPVTPENRFALLTAGDIDLECGSSTDNLERRKQVAFSPTIFVTGTKLLVRKDGADQVPARSEGKDGCRNARHHQRRSDEDTLAKDRSSALPLSREETIRSRSSIFTSGKADAFANDDVLLYAMIADTQTAGRVSGGRRLSVL